MFKPCTAAFIILIRLLYIYMLRCVVSMMHKLHYNM